MREKDRLRRNAAGFPEKRMVWDNGSVGLNKRVEVDDARKVCVWKDGEMEG